MKDKMLLGILIGFIVGGIFGYTLCTGLAASKPAETIDVIDPEAYNAPEHTKTVTTQVTDEAPGDVSVPEIEVSIETIAKPATPSVSGMFSWHSFKKKYLSVLEAYNIDQVYQCFDSQIREGDYDTIKETLNLLSDYDVWLLTGDSGWTAEDMLKKIDVAKEIGGFAGVVFDVEPDTYDEEYLNNVNIVCDNATIPVMFCVSYRATPDIVKEVIAVSDGLLVMNYDVGDEYENIKDYISVAKQYNTTLITVYELQPAGENGVDHRHTYDGDMKAVLSNFEDQFAGQEDVGIAYHYIKYIKAD